MLSSCVSPERQPDPLLGIDSGTVHRKNITIAMLGATGMAGGYIIQEALEQGYDIRALARTPQKLHALKDQITIVEGDARDLSAIDMLLQGSNIVISALGPTKADGDASKTISATATGHIIQSMPEHNINRYILVSGASVYIRGDERKLKGWLIQKLAFLALNDTVKDKQAEYQLLADSSIQWTLVRCPLIKDKPFKRQPKASLFTPSSFSLRAGELAHFVIDQIESEEFVGKAPFLESH
jgi:putative NADH-flavin reductase